MTSVFIAERARTSLPDAARRALAALLISLPMGDDRRRDHRRRRGLDRLRIHPPFQVRGGAPYSLVYFLKSIMPHKRVARSSRSIQQAREDRALPRPPASWRDRGTFTAPHRGPRGYSPPGESYPGSRDRFAAPSHHAQRVRNKRARSPARSRRPASMRRSSSTSSSTATASHPSSWPSCSRAPATRSGSRAIR